MFISLSCCFSCRAHSEITWLRRMRCEFQLNWLINHGVFCNEHKMFECAVVYKCSSALHRQQTACSLIHCFCCWRCRGSGLSRTPSHPPVTPKCWPWGERSPREQTGHCESNTLNWGEYNNKHWCFLLWCVYVAVQIHSSPARPLHRRSCESCTQHLTDKACLQCKIMLTFKLLEVSDVVRRNLPFSEDCDDQHQHR